MTTSRPTVHREISFVILNYSTPKYSLIDSELYSTQSNKLTVAYVKDY